MKNLSSSLDGQLYQSVKTNINLPVVDSLTKYALKHLSFHDVCTKTAIIYIHHSLKTSIDVLEAIITLGINPHNIFVLGKHYSQSIPVVNKIKTLGVHCQPCSHQQKLGSFSQCFIQDIHSLWSVAIKNLQSYVENIIVADHGGYALSFVPPDILKKYHLIGLEKTTGGLINFESWGPPSFPVINVAESAAKKTLESPLIADAVVRKILPLLPPKRQDLTYGVVGYGAIGKAITDKLSSIGYSVMIYDCDKEIVEKSIKSNLKQISIVKDIPTLINLSDYVFGCTGRDIIESSSVIENLKNDKTFISCSSGDKEFLSLLKLAQQQYDARNIVNKLPLDTVQYTTQQGAILSILRGGFPINFDHSGESVPPNDIQLTRALALAGVLQCTQFLREGDNTINKNGIYALDAQLQRYIVNEWMKHQPKDRFTEDTVQQFQNIIWIAKHSKGIKV